MYMLICATRYHLVPLMMQSKSYLVLSLQGSQETTQSGYRSDYTNGPGAQPAAARGVLGKSLLESAEHVGSCHKKDSLGVSNGCFLTYDDHVFALMRLLP